MPMPCGSCVDKLARKLVKHHKIDLIRAYELAEKGVERVENRKDDLVKVEIKSGNPTDYTQACTQSTCALIANACNVGGVCEIVLDCTVVAPCSSTGSCGCPSPLPNSSQVSGCTITCDTTGVCTCRVVTGLCTKGTCAINNCTSGTCGYDCNPPYVWNPVTLACELPAIVPVVGVVQQAKLQDII